MGSQIHLLTILLQTTETGSSLSAPSGPASKSTYTMLALLQNALSESLAFQGLYRVLYGQALEHVRDLARAAHR